MSSYQIGPETYFRLGFQVFDAEGEAVGPEEELGEVFGTGRLLPPVEAAAEGRRFGDRFEVRIPPEKAFGRRRPEAILEVDRSDFPPDVAVGDRFELENAEGEILVAHVLDVHEDAVVLDTNHPLAEQEMKVVAKVLEVRPATSEEIALSEALMAEDTAYFQAGAPDLSIASLLAKRN